MNKNKPREMDSLGTAAYLKREVRKLDIKIMATNDPAALAELRKKRDMLDNRWRGILEIAKCMLSGRAESPACLVPVRNKGAK